MSHNDSLWQGVLLGLGDDGATYHCKGDTWQPYIPPLEPQDVAAKLAAITDQRDRLEMELADAKAWSSKLADIGDEARGERDRLAAVLKTITTLRLPAQYCREIADKALQSLNQPEQ